MMSRVTRGLGFVVGCCSITASALAATLNVPGDYATIQACIDAAVSGVDECVVAPGTYVEAINFNGKAITLRSSGGAAVTTIDGNGALHVVQCINGEGPNTILYGFTITGGNAAGPFLVDFQGGGMYNEGSSPTTTNCAFNGNTARFGAGMFNHASSPTVIHCTFNGNTASSGAGMYNDDVSSPTITNCTFSENDANDSGGGVYNEAGSPTVTDCMFSGNRAFTGGGIANFPFSSPTVTNCMFSGNAAATGGGILNLLSDPTVTNCTFNGNTSDSVGGAMYNVSSNAKVINSAFSGNTANINGGGMHNEHSNPTLTNCTFSRNTAGSDGGGLSSVLNSAPTLANCILWGNNPNEVFNDQSVANVAVSFSDVQGGLPGGTIDDGGNIDADPLFVDADGTDGIIGTNDDNLRLRTTSPCIDAGDNTAPGLVGILTDLDGNDRFHDDPGVPDTGNGTPPIVNMGAYESSCGNGVVNPREECDDGGESAACDADCTLSQCGDGMLNLTADEECDDGNLESRDGCDSTCRVGSIFVPTVSTWGLFIMALLLLVGAKTHFRRHRPTRA